MLKGGLGNLMKQAQQMQENMKKAQDELGNVEVEGQSGSGMVKIVMTCHHEVRRVHIDPAVIDADDKETLEDLIAVAFNDALKKAKETESTKMAGFTAGLNLPPGMKLPF